VNRLLIVAAAVVVAAGLFVVLRPDDDEGITATTAPTTTQATTTTTPTITEPSVPPPPRPLPPPSAQVRITVRGGKPVGGIRQVTVAKGRSVVLIVTSDVADHVHLHGYDVMRDVAPGKPARLSFRATIVGTVEVELEDSGVPLARVTTKP
jgi:hypothetical protein